MYLQNLKKVFIPVLTEDVLKSTPYYYAVDKARTIDKIIEEAMFKNKDKYKISSKSDIEPIIVSLPENSEKGMPLIYLLYHFEPISIIVELYEEKLIIKRSEEGNTIELKANEYEKLKNIF